MLRPLCWFATMLTATTIAIAADPPPKPLREGGTPAKTGWFGKAVLPTKPQADIRMGGWKDGREEYWKPLSLMMSVVREDRDGYVRVSDGRREGWVKRADVVPAEDALTHFTAAVKADDKNLFARWMRGVVRRYRGEYDEAIADFDACLKLDPKDAVTLTSRGQALAAKGEAEKAIADYTAAIRLDPTSAVAFNNRGCVLADTGKYDAAIRDYDEATRLDPQYVLPLYNRGNSWGKKREYEKAIADYTAALALDPSDPDTVAARAFAYGKAKRYGDAVKGYEQALALEPLDWVYREYALFLAGCPDEKLRDRKKALELARRAEKLAGKTANWEYAATLAAAYSTTGDFDTAVAQQEKAIKLLKTQKFPDANELKKAEARLEQFKSKRPYLDE